MTGGSENVRVDTDRRRDWRPYLREALRPETEAVPRSVRAVAVDVLLAVALTAASLVALYHLRIGAQPVPPALPMAPVLPVAPPTPAMPGFRALSVEPREIAEAVLTALPLALRRRWPLAVFWVVLFAMLAEPGWDTRFSLLACAVATFSVVRYGRAQVPAMGSFVLAGVLAASSLRGSGTAVLGFTMAVLGAGLVAALARFMQLRLRDTQLRMAELRQEQEEATRRAVEEERSRIAGELHDVVTHNVSVMVIQAGAARKIMDAAPEQAREALLAIESGGRAAMTELRQVMGLLTFDGADAAELAPQPGLDRLDALVDGLSDSGVPVTLTRSGRPRPVPAGVELAAYRVVQEALTNTIKHAAGAAATVLVEYGTDHLRVQVTDTGGTPGAEAATGGRHGLIGLRERLAVYGGTLRTGPRLTGGYRVDARIPLEST